MRLIYNLTQSLTDLYPSVCTWRGRCATRAVREREARFGEFVQQGLRHIISQFCTRSHEKVMAKRRAHILSHASCLRLEPSAKIGTCTRPPCLSTDMHAVWSIPRPLFWNLNESLQLKGVKLHQYLKSPPEGVFPITSSVHGNVHDSINNILPLKKILASQVSL